MCDRVARRADPLGGKEVMMMVHYRSDTMSRSVYAASLTVFERLALHTNVGCVHPSAHLTQSGHGGEAVGRDESVRATGGSVRRCCERVEDGWSCTTLLVPL